MPVSVQQVRLSGQMGCARTVTVSWHVAEVRAVFAVVKQYVSSLFPGKVIVLTHARALRFTWPLQTEDKPACTERRLCLFVCGGLREHRAAGPAGRAVQLAVGHWGLPR